MNPKRRQVADLYRTIRDHARSLWWATRPVPRGAVDQVTCVALYRSILSYDGAALFDDVVAPWLAQADSERNWLAALRDGQTDPPQPLWQTPSWRLYALSRVLDLLQLSYVPRVDPPEDGWRTQPVNLEQHHAVLQALGLAPLAPRAFHPFFHEIVAVDQDPVPSAPPEIVAEIWPGARLGTLMISRAGCRVRSGRDHIAKEIAETSTLYWAHARNTRPTSDLADGWGSGSQWSTGFRQDHEIDGRLYYNIAVSRDEDDDLDEDLSPAEKQELLRHRCFVRCAKSSEDRWPYDLTLTERLG